MFGFYCLNIFLPCKYLILNLSELNGHQIFNCFSLFTTWTAKLCIWCFLFLCVKLQVATPLKHAWRFKYIWLCAKYLVHVQYTQERSRKNEEELIRLVYNVMSTLKKDRYIDQVAKLFSLLLEGRLCKQIL